MGRFDAKTSLKGQATIPPEVRELIGLEPGGLVQFIVSDEGQVSLIAKKPGLRHLKGLFGATNQTVEVDTAIETTVARRTARDRSEIDP